MANTKMTCAIAVMLLPSLAACVSESAPVAPKPVAPKASFGVVCPMPTPATKLELILEYLETSPPSAGLNALATEWERLDEGVRRARGR